MHHPNIFAALFQEIITQLSKEEQNTLYNLCNSNNVTETELNVLRGKIQVLANGTTLTIQARNFLSFLLNGLPKTPEKKLSIDIDINQRPI